MKNNIKRLRLIGKGFSSKTLDGLSESEISTLYEKIINEQPKPVETTKTIKQVKLAPGAQTTIGKYSISNTAGQTTITQTTEGNLEEISDEDALGADALQDYTGQQGPHDEKDMAPDGMDDDSDDNRKMMDEGRKKKKNPWAICTAQLGKEFKTRERHLWNTKQKNKYERCVKDVKQSLKEGKNPVSLFLENQIMRIVEKHIPPRITKSDLLKYLNEDTKTAPSKPKTKPKTEPKPRPKSPGHNPNPGENPSPKAKKREMDEDTTTAPTKPVTKPTTRPKPKSPGGNPNPGENPSPKARVSPEVAKKEVINAIGQILGL
jgi:hypothetical protein